MKSRIRQPGYPQPSPRLSMLTSSCPRTSPARPPACAGSMSAPHRSDYCVAGVNHGIYRIDDNVVYTLMDNTNMPGKAIYSIAYWGTYASGKLLAGEMLGYTCTATVPVWFTDSPTVCPDPLLVSRQETAHRRCRMRWTAMPACAAGAMPGWYGLRPMPTRA